ncbi:MAG: lysophospholipid acyltransferase family protein [Planctomycetota bacterium]
MASHEAKKRKKKKGNVVTDWLLYAALRVLLLVIGMFSVDRNMKTACFLGRVLWNHYHRGRKRAIDNLRASYPDKDRAWHEHVGQRSFEHIAMLAMDMILTPGLVKKDNWRRYSRFTNCERAKWMMKEGRGLIMLTGHYGNFEIVGYMLGLFGFNVYSIARPLDNRFINRYILGVRQRKGQKIIEKKGAAEIMGNLVNKGATICFIADQDAGKKGIFVDFFGRKASTYKSIGLLAITNNMPIGVGTCRQEYGKFFFDIEVNRIILHEEWTDKEDPLGYVTQEYNKAIEEGIRRDPTQYWWLHRRWKTRPKEQKND